MTTGDQTLLLFILRPHVRDNITVSTSLFLLASDTEFSDALSNLPPYLIPRICKSTNPKFSAKKLLGQKLSLPKPICRYLLNFSKAPVLQKLFECCKSMFSSHPTPITYLLDVGKDVHSQYSGQSVALAVPDLSKARFSNLYVANVLNFKSKDRKALSRFLFKIKKCTANFVCIFHQDLSLAEFTFLTINVKYLFLRDTRITDTVENVIPNDEIKRMFNSTVEIWIK